MKPLVVIKIGGRSIEKSEALDSLIREIGVLSDNYRFVLVHGGGTAVSGIQKKYGIEPVFDQGLRMTSSAEMDIVDMGLAGLMNTGLVRRCRSAGLDAVGLSGNDGGLFRAESIGSWQGEKNRTGRIVRVDTRLVETLLGQGFFPVASSVAADSSGDGMNTNADDAGFALAAALKAEILLFISDIPGVMKEDAVIRRLSFGKAEGGITEGWISGGMIPKIRSSLTAIRDGVGSVVISDYNGAGDLALMINEEKGTKLVS
jgi:acetylglutamate kinase